MVISLNNSAVASGSGGSISQHPLPLARKKEIQMQLMALLHAKRCSLKAPYPNKEKCTEFGCKIMQDVLAHMENCADFKDCAFENCTRTRMILLHFNNCTKSDCVFCFPFRPPNQLHNSGNAAANVPGELE